MRGLLTFTQKCINCYNELVKSVARYAAWYGLHSVAVYFSVALSMIVTMKTLCHWGTSTFKGTTTTNLFSAK